MKKAIYVLFGIFTFSVGFWLFNLRPLVVPVTLCEIPQNPNIYGSKKVHINAYIDNVGISEDDLTYFSVFDFGSECLTGAGLNISENLKEQLKNDASLKSFVDELRLKNNHLIENRSDGHFIGQVEITGTIKKAVYNNEIASEGTHLPFEIEADEIKQIAPIRFMSQEEIIKLPKFYKEQ